MKSFHLLPFAFSLLEFGLGQQFAGTPYAVNVPDGIKGAQKAFFNIRDNAGGRTTFMNYYSAPNGTMQDPKQVKRAIIYIHGSDQNPQNYFNNIYAALQQAHTLNPNVNESTVALMAPYFNIDSANVAGTNALQWEVDLGFTIRGWSTGRNNILPAGQNVSSFDVLDQIIQYFNNATTFPKMNQVVVAGHSMGAQFVHRYAAVGKVLSLRVPLTYWIGNPSSFLWLNSSRPIAPVNCPQFNDWNQGFANYNVDYEKAFVTTNNTQAIRARFNTRRIAYARGLSDFGDSSDGDCRPFSTGANRGERFNRFMTAFPPDSGDTVDYVPNIGHSDALMSLASSGSARLFLDNFEGDGVRAPSSGQPGPNAPPA